MSDPVTVMLWALAVVAVIVAIVIAIIAAVIVKIAIRSAGTKRDEREMPDGTHIMGGKRE